MGVSPMYDWINYLPRWQAARRASPPPPRRGLTYAQAAALIAATMDAMDDLRR